MKTISSCATGCTDLSAANDYQATVGTSSEQTYSSAILEALVNGGSSKSITGTVVLPAINDPSLNGPASGAAEMPPSTSGLNSLLQVEFGKDSAKFRVDAQQAPGAPQHGGGILMAPGAIRPMTPGEKSLLDSMARTNRDYREQTAEEKASHAKVEGLTAESWGNLERVSQDFVMYSAGKSFCAYERATGVEHGEAGFIQLARKRYGVLEPADPDAKEQRISLGKTWWHGEFHHKRIVSRVVMEPNDLTSIEDALDRPDTLNLWHAWKRDMAAPNMNATFEDIRPLWDHLLFLSDGDEVGSMYFLCWLAQLYQFPGTKIPTAILLYSKNTRMGKSMLWKLLAAVFGPRMVGSCSGKALTKSFDDVTENKRLLVVHEMARSEKADNYENFKNQISEEQVSFEGKGRAAKDIVNITHFVVTTNNPDALPLMDGDGRVLVLQCLAERKDNAYYARLVAWMAGEGPALLAGVLAQWTFHANWDPYAPVPQTAATRAMQRAVKGELYDLVRELVDTRQEPFDRDIIAVDVACAALNRLYQGSLTKPANLTSLGKVLKSICGEPIARQVVNLKGAAVTARFYYLRNAEQWLAASPTQRGEHMKTGARMFPVQDQNDEVVGHE